MAIPKKSSKQKQVKEDTDINSKLTVKKHLIIREIQRNISEDLFVNSNPSEVTGTYWIFASRKKKGYPKPNLNCGKWLIFVSIKNVDKVWKNIKLATENGLLGGESKVATAKPNPNATKKDLKVICVYTYDYTDKEDAMRIRDELKKIGITNKIPYKTDNATRAGQYIVNGNKQISIYFE